MFKAYNKTRIAGCCAISTECSDHILNKIYKKFLFKYGSFFVHCEMRKLYKRVEINMATLTTVVFNKRITNKEKENFFA